MTVAPGENRHRVGRRGLVGRRAILLAQIAQAQREAERLATKTQTSTLRADIAKFYELIQRHGSPDIADYLQLDGRRAVNFASFLNSLAQRLGIGRRVMTVGDLRRAGVRGDVAWLDFKTQLNEMIFAVAEKVCEGDLDSLDRAISDVAGFSPADHLHAVQAVADLYNYVEQLKAEYESLPPRTRHGIVRGWVFYDERTGYWHSIDQLDELEFVAQRLLGFLRRAAERELCLRDLAMGRRRKLKHANAKINKRVRALLMMGNYLQAFEDVKWGSEYVLEEGKRVLKPVRAEVAREFIPVWRDGRVVRIKRRYCYNRTKTRWLIRASIRANRLRAMGHLKMYVKSQRACK
jgi:hypothetical protein